MLPAAHRMRAGGDFDRAVRSGRRLGRDTVVLHVVWGDAQNGRPQTGDEAVDDASSSVPPSRIGLVVSRAVGPSVVRSRVKRRLRHLMRDRLSRFPDGSLVVVRATPRTAAASTSVLGGDLDRLIDKAAGGSTGRRGAPV